jgi:hypothetical protein
MAASEAGKGSKQRPTDLDQYYSNYDLIFGKKDKKKVPEKEETVPVSENKE